MGACLRAWSRQTHFNALARARYRSYLQGYKLSRVGRRLALPPKNKSIFAICALKVNIFKAKVFCVPASSVCYFFLHGNLCFLLLHGSFRSSFALLLCFFALLFCCAPSLCFLLLCSFASSFCRFSLLHGSPLLSLASLLLLVLSLLSKGRGTRNQKTFRGFAAVCGEGTCPLFAIQMRHTDCISFGPSQETASAKPAVWSFVPSSMDFLLPLPVASEVFQFLDYQTLVVVTRATHTVRRTYEPLAGSWWVWPQGGLAPCVSGCTRRHFSTTCGNYGVAASAF